MFSADLEFWFWLVLSQMSSWVPVVYAGVMAGFAIWVLRHRPIPAVRWLAIGFGASAVCGAVSRIARTVAFPDYMVEGEFGQVFPNWIYTIDSVVTIVRLVSYFLIVCGFWKLCVYLVHGSSSAPQPAPPNQADGR